MSGFTGGIGYTPLSSGGSGGSSGNTFPVTVATTANISLTSAPTTIDGYTLVLNDTILVKNQTPDSGSGNPADGIYNFNGVGNPLTRNPQYTVWINFVGLTVLVGNGGQKNIPWASSAQPGGTIDVTNLLFLNASEGNFEATGGITKTGNNITLTTVAEVQNAFFNAVDGSGNLVAEQPFVGTPLVPTNTAILAGDTITTLADKTQGQFNAATNFPTANALMRYDANGNVTVNTIGIAHIEYDLTVEQVGGVVNITLPSNSPGFITIFQSDTTNYNVTITLPTVDSLPQDNDVSYSIFNLSVYSDIIVQNSETDQEGAPITYGWIGVYEEFQNDWEVYKFPTDAVNLTIQGNNFNGANQLVQLNGTAQLPSIDSSLTTIGALSLTNTALANNDAEGVAFGKVQGQINAIIAEVITPTVRTIAAGTTTTISTTDVIIQISGGSGATTLTLPSGTAISQFKEFQIIENSGNPVIIKNNTGTTINNLLPYWQVTEILQTAGTTAGVWIGNNVPTQKATSNTIFGALTIQAITSNTTLTSWGVCVEASTISTSINATLPPSSGAIPGIIRIIKVDSNESPIFTLTQGGNTINGNTTGGITLNTKGQYVDYQCDGSTDIKIISTNVTTDAEIYVQVSGNDTTAQPYNQFLPFATLQAAANSATLGDTINVGPNVSGYTDLTLDSASVLTVNFQGLNSQLGSLQITDEHGGGEEISINNALINSGLSIYSFRDSINTLIFNGCITNGILYDISGGTSGFQTGGNYTNVNVISDIRYFQAGFASQTTNIFDTFNSCIFGLDSTINMELYGNKMNVRFYNCYPLPDIFCSEGATTKQIVLNNHPNILTGDYLLMLNDSGGTINVPLLNNLLYVDTTKICPNFKTTINCDAGASCSILNAFDDSQIAKLYGGQSADILIDNDLNIHINVTTANIIQNYEIIALTTALALPLASSPVIYLSATAPQVVYLPDNSTAPHPGQMYSIYNQGTAAITIEDPNTTGAPFLLANLLPNTGMPITFVRNTANTAWEVNTPTTPIITLTGTQVFTFGGGDNGEFALNLVGNTTRINLQNTVGQPYTGQSLKIVNLPTSSGIAQIFLTSTGSLWSTIAVGSSLSVIYNGASFVPIATAPIPTSGSWTPADGSGASLTLTFDNNRYVSTGSTVQVQANILYPTTANTNSAMISGFPVGTTGGTTVVIPMDTNGTLEVYGGLSGTTLNIFNATTGVAVTNAQLSGLKVLINSGYIP